MEIKSWTATGQHSKKSNIPIGQRWRETPAGHGIPRLLEGQDTKSTELCFTKPLVKDREPHLRSTVRTIGREWLQSGTHYTYSITAAFHPIEPRRQRSSEDRRRTTDHSSSTLYSLEAAFALHEGGTQLQNADKQTPINGESAESTANRQHHTPAQQSHCCNMSILV
jgi:hypothetical protein